MILKRKERKESPPWMSAVTAVNTHCGPQRVMARGVGGLALLPRPSSSAVRSPDRLSSHTLATPSLAKCISIICPQDDGDDEGFYGPNESNCRKGQALLANCILMLRLILLNSVLIISCKSLWRVAHESSHCSSALFSCEHPREGALPVRLRTVPAVPSPLPGMEWVFGNCGLFQQWSYQVYPRPQ